MLFSTFGFVCVVVCLVEAAILVVLLEEQLMGEKKSADEPGIAMMLLRIVCGAAIAVTLALMPVLISKPLWDHADPYGLLNAGVSALAFAAVIQSLWYQQKQLKLQSRELRLQRKDLRQNLDEYKEMVKAQKSSDQRLFFTAYLNALDALRESNLNPAKGNVNKPETVLPAIRQRSVNKQLTRVLEHLADEGQSLYGISSQQDDDQQVLEEFGALLHPLWKIFQFSNGHGRYDSQALAPLLTALHGRLISCQIFVEHEHLLTELTIEVGDLAVAAQNNNFSDDKWAATENVFRKCVQLANTKL
jgi:hypothetical protein